MAVRVRLLVAVKLELAALLTMEPPSVQFAKVNPALGVAVTVTEEPLT